MDREVYRLGDFTPLRLQVAARPEAAQESAETLSIGDIILVTAAVSYAPEGMLADGHYSGKKRLRSREVVSTELMLCAEGTADPVVRVIESPSTPYNPRLHTCLFEVHRCLIPAQPSKKAEKDFTGKTLGATVLLGEEIQLRHIISGKYLGFSLSPGTAGFQIQLESRSERSTWLKVLSGPRTVQSGRPVVLGDQVVLSVKSAGVDCFMYLHGRKCSYEQAPIFEVANFTQETYFTLQRFSPKSANPTSISLCDILQFQHKELGYYLSASRSKDAPSQLFLTKNNNEPYTYWRLEPTSGKVGGAVKAEGWYLLRNVVNGGFVTAELTLSTEAQGQVKVVVSGKTKGQEVVEGTDLVLEVEENQRIRMMTDDMQGQDVFKMIPIRKGKEADKEVRVGLGRDFSEEILYILEVRKVPHRDAEFIRRTAELLPHFHSFYTLVESISSQAQLPAYEIERRLKTLSADTVRGLQFLSGVITSAQSREVMEMCQDCLVGCGLHVQLLDIARLLMFRLETTEGTKSIGRVSLAKKARAMRSVAGGSLARALTDSAAEVIPAVLSLLNHIAYQNERTSAQLSKLDNEICQLFPFSKKLTANLLSEIYRLVDPPILNYPQYYEQWFDRLQTVTKENIDEQIAFVRLLRHVSEEQNEVNVLAQAELLKLLKSGERMFRIVDLRSSEDQICVYFHQKAQGLSPDKFLEANSDLLPIALHSSSGEVLFPLHKLESSKNLLKYAKYVSEALQLVNTACRDNQTEALAIAQQEMGLRSDVILQLCKDDQLGLSLRRGFVVLSTTFVLASQETVKRLKTRVPTLLVREELESAVEHTGDSSHLVNWCLQFWAADFQARESAAEALDFLAAVTQLTAAVIDKEYGGEAFVKSVNPFLEFLLMGLVSPSSPYLPVAHWTIALMKKVAEERKLHPFGLNQSLRYVTEIVIAQIKRNAEAMNRYKVRELMLHFSNMQRDGGSAVQDIRGIVTRQSVLLEEVRDRVSTIVIQQDAAKNSATVDIESFLQKTSSNTKQFLCSIAFSNLEIDTDTRNALMDLLVELLNKHSQLSSVFKSTQFLEDPLLVNIRSRLARILPNFAVVRSEAKFAMIVGEKDSEELQGVVDGLEQLLGLLTRRNAKPDVRLSTQDMVRHHHLHILMVQLWANIEKSLQTPSDFQAFPILAQIFRLTADCLYYFVLDNERNRLELLWLVRASFFTVYTRNAAYMIQELTDFEHVPQRSAYLCYVAILKKCTFVPQRDSLWTGLTWIHASIRRRDSKRCKHDLQIVVAMAVIDHLTSLGVSIAAHKDKQSLSLVLALLAEASEDNPLVQGQTRTLLPLSVLLSSLETADFPPLFAALVAVLVEAYGKPQVEVSEEWVGSVLQLAGKWVERVVATGQSGLRTLAFGGWFAKAFPNHNPELVDVHGDRIDPSSTALLWELVTAGDCWKHESGLCHTLPYLLLAVPDPGRDIMRVIRSTAEKVKSLLQVVTAFATQNDSTVDSFYLLRAVSACYEAFGLYWKGERSSDKVGARFAANERRELHSVETIDRLFAGEVVESVLTSPTSAVRLKTSIELLDLEFQKFAGEVARVCTENTLTASFAIKSMLFTLPVFSGLRQATVPYRVRASAITLIKMMVRKLDRQHHSSIFDTLAIMLEESRDRLMAKEVFTASGAAAAAVSAIVAQQDLATMKSAIKLLCKLLDVLGEQFQTWLLNYLQDTETYLPIFQLLSAELTCSIDRVTFRSQQSGTSSTLVPSERLLLPRFFTTGMTISALLELNYELTLSLVQLVTSCCDGCHKDFQAFMSVQNRGFEGERGTISVVRMVANYLVNIAANPRHLLGDEQARKMIDACCEALVEMVTGPCEDNQALLGADIQLLSALVSLMELCNENRNVRDWLDLYADILAFLHTLLEGSPSQTELETIGNYLKIPALTEAMEAIYAEHIQHQERAVLLEEVTRQQQANIDIGFSIAMLVMKLRGVLPNHADLLDYAEESWSEGLVFNYFALGVMRHIPRNCFGFYGSLIGYVEINRNGSIEGNYFKIPYKCKFLTTRTKRDLINESMSTSKLQKLFNFLHYTQVYSVEMAHQQDLYRRPWLKVLSQSWSFFAFVSFFLISLINVVLMVKATFDTLTYMDEEERSKPFAQAIALLGSVQLAVSAIGFLGFMREYYPNLLTHAMLQVGEELSFQEYPRIWHNESILAAKATSREEAAVSLTAFRKLRILAFNATTLYYSVFLLVSLAAIFVPALYCLLLLDIFKNSRDLVVVVNSVTLNWRQLLNTLWLTILVTFMFAMVSLVVFTNYFTDTSNPLFCESMWECFVSSFIVGVRVDGGGLGIAMRLPLLDDQKYYPRMLFDMLYFAIVILVIRNLIQGVIVDAFGDMRAQKTELDTELNQTCFICGGRRQEMERAKGWAYHFLNEHSLFSYMAFIIYVGGKEDNQCTGLEKYVKDCIANKNCEFFPDTSRYLQGLKRREDSE